MHEQDVQPRHDSLKARHEFLRYNAARRPLGAESLALRGSIAGEWGCRRLCRRKTAWCLPLLVGQPFARVLRATNAPHEPENRELTVHERPVLPYADVDRQQLLSQRDGRVGARCSQVQHARGVDNRRVHLAPLVVMRSAARWMPRCASGHRLEELARPGLPCIAQDRAAGPCGQVPTAGLQRCAATANDLLGPAFAAYRGGLQLEWPIRGNEFGTVNFG